MIIKTNTMSFYILEDNIILNNKHDLVCAHIYLQFKKDGVSFSENDINILAELYISNGYKNKAEQDLFFKMCLNKKYKKSFQSIRNTLNNYTNLGFLLKPKNLQRFVNVSLIPKIDAGNIGAIYKLSYANN